MNRIIGLYPIIIAEVYYTSGVFTYTHLDLPYYSFGLQQSKLTDEQYAMIASPEKA